MACLDCHIVLADFATNDGAYKTFASIQAPSTAAGGAHASDDGGDQFVRVKGVGIGFSGVSGGAKPLTIRWLDITGGSAGTATAHTPVILNTQLKGLAQAPRSICKVNYSAEPDGDQGTTYLMRLHPQGGTLLQIPFDNFIIGPGDIMALQIKVEASETEGTASGYIHFEE